MAEAVKSFEFKKGISLYYRYNNAGEIEVLYMDKWIGLYQFTEAEYKGLMTYPKQKEEIKKAK
jgi:hypothetical protein